MATVTGLTAARMQEIINKTIVDADIVSNRLILTLEDGSTIDAGAVGPAGKGTAFPAGATDGDLFVRTDQPTDPLYKYTDGAWQLFTGGGVGKGAAFPTFPVPTDGDMYVRTDQNGDPLYKYSDGVWELQPRMGGLTPPAVYLRHSTNTGSVAGDQVVAWDIEDADTDTMHDAAVNTDRITIKTPGWYTVVLNIATVTANAAGNRAIATLKKNGSVIAQDSIDDDQYEGSVVWSGRLNVGDFLQASLYSGNAMSVQASAYTNFSAVWLGGAGQTVDERGVPAARATVAAGTQSVPSPGDAVVAFPTEDFDTDGMHDTVTNTSRLTIKTPGLYHVEGFVETATFPDTSGSAVNIMKNGALAGPDPYYLGVQSTTTGRVAVQGMIMLAAGDYLELQFVNGATSARTILRSHFSAVLIGSGKTVTPFARVKHSASQSIPAAVRTTVAFDSEDSDNDAIHDVATNNTRLTARTAGIYVVSASLEWAAGSNRQLSIAKNGNVSIPLAQTKDNAAAQTVTTIVELAVGDYVETVVYTDGATTLSTTSFNPTMQMAKIGAPLAGQTGIGPAQADVFTVATLPAANTFPNGRIVGVSDGAAGQQARMSMNGAWINLG